MTSPDLFSLVDVVLVRPNRSRCNSSKGLEVHEKDDGTHKPRGGELVSRSNETLKIRVKKKKTSFSRIISQTFDKPIFNQSPLIQNLLLKFFLKNIFSLTFSKLIKTRIR